MRDAARLGTRPIADSGRLGPSASANAAPHLLDALGRQFGYQLTKRAHQLVRGAHPLVEPDAARRQVAATAQHDADPVAVAAATSASARVLDRLGRHAQRDELVGLGAGYRVGHDPELERVDRGEFVDEAAAPAVDPVRRGLRTAAGS